MIDGGHIEDQAAGRALDALTPEEQAEVDKHVDTCLPCRRLLNEAQDTAHMLALTAQPVRPPRRCRERILAAIERDEFLFRPNARRSRSLGWTRWAAMGAFALVMIGWNVRLQQELARQSLIQEAVIGDSQPKALKPRGDGPATASGRVFMAPSGQDAVLVIENLQPAPAGKVYQVWVKNDKVEHGMETFQVHQPREKLIMHAPVPLTNYKWVMITVEDAGGSKTPSEQTVLFGDLPLRLAGSC